MTTPPTAIAPQDLLKSVKAEIKAWEREFQQENGRKPTKEDVYKDTDIFELYKLFNKLKSENKPPVEKQPKAQPATTTVELPALTEVPSKRPQATPALGTDAIIVQPIPTRPTPRDEDQPSPLPEPSESPDDEARPQRPGTASSISRTEALKKHQASRKRQTANVGRVVQSGAPGPSAPVLTVETSTVDTTIPGQVPIISPTSISSPSSIRSPNSPINIEDDGIAHPTTMHIIAPESALEESATLPFHSPESSGNAPQLKRNAFAHGTESPSEKVQRPTSASSSSSGGVEVDTSDGDDGRSGGMVASMDQLNDEDKSEVSAAPGAEPTKGEEVLKSLGVEPLAVLSSVLKPPAIGEVLRGIVSRVKVPTRPNVTSFYFKNEADNTVIASARREPSLKMKPTYYLFDHGLPNDAVKESSIWRIKGNFEGSTFRITDGRTSDLLGIVHYTSSCVPRAMLVVASTPTSGPITARQEELLTSSHFNWPPASNSELANSRLLVYRNKLPKFNETMKTFCLNFHGRVTMPSVKNFQLALADEVDEPGSKGTGGLVRLQFGRIGRDAFSIDVHDPMMVMMGWAVALTTFDAIEKV